MKSTLEGATILGGDERRLAAELRKGGAMTESEPSLVQMVKLLQSRSALKMHVVGHTDNVGTLELNLKLSTDRADAVVKAIVGRGIAASRLKAAGVASYCPVASNATEQGRAQNRRVELVEQ